MGKRGVDKWILQPEINRILFSFHLPKTPGQVEKELGINKLKLKPFLEKKLIESMNPEAKKGRYYSLTRKAKKLLNLPVSNKSKISNWHLYGWVMSSPKQRLIVLKAMDSEKRTSEEIRARASKYNPHLTRISTKCILNELINKELIASELIIRKRCYWITNKGKLFTIP